MNDFLWGGSQEQEFSPQRFGTLPSESEPRPSAREEQLQGAHICESFENFMMNKNYPLHRLMHYILTEYRYKYTTAGLLLLCTFFLMTLTPVINSDIENVDSPVT